jgi:hypothetical protein
VLCHAQDLGLAGKTGVRYRKPERPEGCFAFSVPDPIFQRDSVRGKGTIALIRLGAFSGALLLSLIQYRTGCATVHRALVRLDA